MTEILKYFQEKVVFFPVVLSDDHEFTFEKNFDEYFWETAFDGRINALHFKTKNPTGVILYFHGNADNLQRWGKIAADLTDYNYDVLVIDYRGYGKSTGPRNEEYLHSDAQFAYDFAKNIYGEENIIIYGRSLGGAFAIKVAAENEPKAVILECTFFSLQDIVNRWLPKQVTNRVSPTMRYHFLSHKNIAKVQAPLYHFHGTKDFVVPLKSGEKLFEVFEKAQPDTKKKFIQIEGGNHDDLSNFNDYQAELGQILK